MDRVSALASKQAVVMFTNSSCCMCHSIKTLLYDLGASPTIHELDMDVNGREMERALRLERCETLQTQGRLPACAMEQIAVDTRINIMHPSNKKNHASWQAHSTMKHSH
ncbi:hypothetical protein QQ045_024378 [Rhodiola kirilowii]